MTILNEAAGGALRWWREVRGWKPVAIFVLGLCLGVGTVAAACNRPRDSDCEPGMSGVSGAAAYPATLSELDIAFCEAERLEAEAVAAYERAEQWSKARLMGTMRPRTRIGRLSRRSGAA